MIRIELTEAERHALVETFKTTADRRLRERCQAVLMAGNGRRRQQIAQDLAVHRASVHAWLKRYWRQGIEGLKIHWAPGQPGRIPPALAPIIIDWVKQGPVGCGLNRANWTFAELATHLYHTHGIEVSETTMREFCHRHGIRPYRPTYRFLRGDPDLQAAARQDLEAFKEKAQAGECVLLSQDEARFPLVPTLRATLGVKGFRPLVGTWDNKDLVYCFAALNLVSGRLTTRLVDSPARATAKTGKSKTRRLQEAFARHLRDIGQAYPAEQCREVIVVIDKAPWHRGALITETLRAYPHLRLYPLPSYSPQLNTIERLWRVLRRRATHNRLFESPAELRAALRASLCYYQTLKHKVLSLIQRPRKVAKLAAA